MSLEQIQLFVLIFPPALYAKLALLGTAGSPERACARHFEGDGHICGFTYSIFSIVGAVLALTGVAVVATN